MTDEVQARELFRFADPGQSVSVEVEFQDPLTTGQERYFTARIVLESGFVRGRLGLLLASRDLDDWERCLDALRAGERATWPSGDRVAWLEVAPEDPVEVTVRDSPSTQIVVRVPIDVTDDWLEENRVRLARVRKAVER
ncbi:DUF5959 family protein [Nocardiopsis sp. NPDC058631]|uniref:DUF5959 family protein n=1 Tax=Nocardiopsis sp. NPDC058631 TaxID=3346566 RepID=UPI00364CC9A5